MTSSTSFPEPEVGLALHRRLATDPTAQADICAAYVEPLSAWLLCQFRPIDAHLCYDAASQALMDYLSHPERFDPGRLDLGAYLRMLARGDMRNLYRKERRHQRRRNIVADVENVQGEGNTLRQAISPLAQLIRDEDRAEAQKQLAIFRADCSPEEVIVLDLMATGERSNETYVAALGLCHLAAEDQERTVKRTKDRLKKRMKRGYASHE